MRKEVLQIVGDRYKAENVPFTFSLKEGSEEVYLAPYVYITSLWDKIESILTKMTSNTYLTTHCTLFNYWYSHQAWLSSLAW